MKPQRSTDHLDPAEHAEWQPTSHTWARRAAITAAADAIKAAKDRRTTDTEETAP